MERGSWLRGGRGGLRGGSSNGKSDSGGGKSGGGAGNSLLVEYLEKRVSVITNDGRVILGQLRGFDQVCNIVLDGCTERIFSKDAGVETTEFGLQVIRGDNMYDSRLAGCPCLLTCASDLHRLTCFHLCFSAMFDLLLCDSAVIGEIEIEIDESIVWKDIKVRNSDHKVHRRLPTD
jgi:small nuclear ribonucleoprotein (snRNP)-like protein